MDADAIFEYHRRVPKVEEERASHIEVFNEYLEMLSIQQRASLGMKILDAQVRAQESGDAFMEVITEAALCYLSEAMIKIDLKQM